MASVVHSEQFLVASFNGDTRFLLDDGSLAIVRNMSKTEIYSIILGGDYPHNNNLTFWFGEGHAAMSLECQKCDNGRAVYKFYDLNGPVFSHDVFPVGVHFDSPSLNFSLNNNQAKATFSAISNIEMLSKNGTYKFVRHIHDCVSFLVDVYNKAGFSHHFSNYLTNYELIGQDGELILGKTALMYRFYYPYPDNYLDSSRKELTKAISSIVPPKISQRYDWLYQPVDLDMFQGNRFILNKIEEVKKIRKEIYPKLIKISAIVYKYNVTDNELYDIAQYYINEAITYDDLYYTYVLEHMLRVGNLLQDTLYKEALEDFIASYIEDCNMIEVYNMTGENCNITDIEKSPEICSGLLVEENWDL